jgi:hypothetical protein
MKIVIVKTSGVDENLFIQTLEFFKGISGFAVIGYPRSITMNTNHGPAEFDDFFSRIDLVRDVATEPLIDEEDFVVLLTDVANQGGYFSFFQKSKYKRNAFVNINDWEFFTGSLQVHYALAYQIVENCLQSLMNLDEEEGHINPRGCLNDFCGYKPDVILKMQTANICPDCIKRIRAYPDALAFQNYALRVMNSVRSNLVLGIEENPVEDINPDECRLIVNSENLEFKVFWRENEISVWEFTPLQYVVYMSFFQEFGSFGYAFNNLERPEAKEFFESEYNRVNGRGIAIKNLIERPRRYYETRAAINRKIGDGFNNDLLESLSIKSTTLLNKLLIDSEQNNQNVTIYKVGFSKINCEIN